MARTKHTTTGNGTHRERAYKAKSHEPRNSVKERRHSEVENARYDLHQKRKASRREQSCACPIPVPLRAAAGRTARMRKGFNHVG